MFILTHYTPKEPNKEVKLYWFIPDGMRADPYIFKVFEWAENGELPNIKRMMDNGAYGYVIPVFPSHTPVNYAAMLTGTYPKTNGVADGPMHIEGKPLDNIAIGGFSSVARKVPAIWSILEKENKSTFVISIPGSTPPETSEGTVIRGRWGNWGADFYAVIFQSNNNGSQRRSQGREARLFYLGPQLTIYPNIINATDWKNIPTSFSTPLESEMDAWGVKIYTYLFDSTNDNKINYDQIIFSKDKEHIITVLKQEEWSDWYNITLKWQEHNVTSNIKFNLIKIDDDGFFRIRVLYNNLNKYIMQPSEDADAFISTLGPMVDFVDNYPPQLIYYPEDKKTFIDEMKFSFDWHTNVIPFIMSRYKPDIVIHGIYNPNQMLTSRWWMGNIDPKSIFYNSTSYDEKEKALKDVKTMYKQLDIMVGKILENTDNNTIIVLSSDHGVAPLNKKVMINNLLAKNGFLKFNINQSTGEPIIDWKNSKAIYLKMDNIYINPNGLDGNWVRGEGKEYEGLREQVIKLLSELKDDDGISPVDLVVKWEDVDKFLSLPKDRVGDLVIANKLGYGWDEEMSEDLKIFKTPLETGYKQAILPQNETSMWTPFIIMGPGVKKGYKILTPQKMIDEYPTILKLLGVDIPIYVDGKPINEIFGK